VLGVMDWSAGSPFLLFTSILHRLLPPPDAHLNPLRDPGMVSPPMLYMATSLRSPSLPPSGAARQARRHLALSPLTRWWAFSRRHRVGSAGLLQLGWGGWCSGPVENASFIPCLGTG